jgi:glutamate-1-semialdehyde 2,1-aminomutase
MNKGQKLLKQAKKIIPGGNQLLSKRSEMFLPGYWPVYYKKAKGTKIWDLENNIYHDFAGMGVTSAILGYSDNDLNNAINAGLKRGSMTTLNSTEEVDLAKELIKIHKWSNMAKFCKSGGEACMVAIRIARGFSKKQNIAFCGYHGWHDWYLAANMSNSKNLDKQLLPGLDTKGVSKSFKGSIMPFYYNDIKSLERLFNKKKNNIGVVIMEPTRGIKSHNKFLENVKKLTKKNKAILIFDEITSGFKDNYGGIHLKLKVNPDMAIFGKSIGNGYPISAIIGKRNIMESSQGTFISSTMWTESLGFVAARETLKKLKKFNINKRISSNGVYLKSELLKLATKNKLNMTVSGLNSILYLSFNYPNNSEILTFFTQEMLKKGFLTGSQIFISFKHKKNIIDKYLKAANNIFYKIHIFINKKKFPLKGQIKHTTFRRLTG